MIYRPWFVSFVIKLKSLAYEFLLMGLIKYFLSGLYKVDNPPPFFPLEWTVSLLLHKIRPQITLFIETGIKIKVVA